MSRYEVMYVIRSGGCHRWTSWWMSSLDLTVDVIVGPRSGCHRWTSWRMSSLDCVLKGEGGGSVCGLPDVFGKGWTKTSRRMGQDEQEEGSIHYVKYFNFCFRPY